MSPPNQKLILTDCDGCFLDWEYSFHTWMEYHGYSRKNHANKMYNLDHQYGIEREVIMGLIHQFNQSAAIGFLPAVRDSVHFVKMLHERHGYQFHVISSVSDDPCVGKLRRANLFKLFGRDTFAGITCLPTGADKRESLMPYQGSGMWWIEDHPDNSDVGHELGLKSILVEHGYNRYHRPTDYPVVKDWSEIYNLVVNNPSS